MRQFSWIGSGLFGADMMKTYGATYETHTAGHQTVKPINPQIPGATP
jgi:hypothetical protein